MKAMPLEQINDVSTRWLRFLPRWSLVAGLVILALPILIFGGVGIAILFPKVLEMLGF